MKTQKQRIIDDAQTDVQFSDGTVHARYHHNKGPFDEFGGGLGVCRQHVRMTPKETKQERKARKSKRVDGVRT